MVVVVVGWGGGGEPGGRGGKGLRLRMKQQKWKSTAHCSRHSLLNCVSY